MTHLTVALLGAASYWNGLEGRIHDRQFNNGGFLELMGPARNTTRSIISYYLRSCADEFGLEWLSERACGRVFGRRSGMYMSSWRPSVTRLRITPRYGWMWIFCCAVRI